MRKLQTGKFTDAIAFANYIRDGQYDQYLLGIYKEITSPNRELYHGFHKNIKKHNFYVYFFLH